MRIPVGVAALLALAACSTSAIQGGPRPPQGAGPAGTQFGFWDRDAEGAVDASFRSYISRTYDVGDEARARVALEQDGFKCENGDRPDGRPVPTLECERLYSVENDVHAWTVEFWPNEQQPRAHYARTHVRDTLHNYKPKRGGG